MASMSHVGGQGISDDLTGATPGTLVGQAGSSPSPQQSTAVLGMQPTAPSPYARSNVNWYMAGADVTAADMASYTSMFDSSRLLSQTNSQSCQLTTFRSHYKNSYGYDCNKFELP